MSKEKGANAPKKGEQGFQKTGKKKPATPTSVSSKAKKSTQVAKPKVLVQTPEEQFEAFKRVKREAIEQDIATKAAVAFKQAEKKRIQDEIWEKINNDTVLLQSFFDVALPEESLSKYVLINIVSNATSLERIIDGIVEPSRYLEHENDDDEDALYDEGHEPIVYAKDGTPVGFIKGDDQIRIVGRPNDGIQAKYEAWVIPSERGKGLELVGINKSIEKKFAVHNFIDPTEATFQVIVWDGNDALALDLLREGWEPVMPEGQDLLKEENQKFHLFNKTFVVPKNKKS